jgi:TolB-like protein/DNA-binding winged helix-turn-helix (wHTH) protein
MRGRFSGRYEFGPFELDTAEHCLRRGGERVAIPPKLFELLEVLINNRGHLVSKDQLLGTVWSGRVVEEGNVNRSISLLRKLLGDDAGTTYIETVPKFGYRFVAPVRAIPADPAAPPDAGAVGPPPDTSVSITDTGGRTSVAGTSSGRRRLLKVAPALALSIAALALMFGLIPWNRPQDELRAMPAEAAPGGAAAEPAQAREMDHQEGSRTIAVLPFVHLSADPETYFTDGVTEELLNRLARTDGLRVAARTSAFAFRNSGYDVGEIGRRLRVETVLEGSVRKAGNRILITAQLIDVAHGYQVWSQRYDRELEDVVAIQDEIAREIVSTLAPRLVDGRGREKKPRSVEAYDAYLRARALFWTGGDDNLRSAAELYGRAIDEDPEYALAHAGLADALMMLAVGGALPPREAMPEAKAAALRALELDDQLPEGYVALASINWYYDWDWAAAERHYRRSFSADHAAYAYWTPRNRCACYVWYIAVLGDIDGAIKEAERARMLDPVAQLPAATLAEMYLLGKRLDDAEAQLLALAELDPASSTKHWLRVWLDWERGEHAEAIAGLERLRQANVERSGTVDTLAPIGSAALAYFYAETGRVAEALEVAQTLRARALRHYVPPEFVAAAFGAVGAVDEATEWIERAYENRSNLGGFSISLVARTLAEVPRYSALLADIGVPSLREGDVLRIGALQDGD